jgi:glucuronate isomerase
MPAEKMNVQVVCTTDDPVDDLQFHKKISDDKFSIKVLPTFRPDRAVNVSEANAFNDYVNKLETVADIEINDFKAYIDALKSVMIILLPWAAK